MGKYKIPTIVLLTVLSFHVRILQARSLEDVESAHNIPEQDGNIEEWTQQCACFPKSDKGLPVSQYLPPDVDHKRLVVYLYKNQKTNKLTAYIPSWKKQGSFPDLSFDFEDKLEQVPYEGISNLFDKANFPKSSKGVHVTPYPVTILVPKDDGMAATKVISVPNYQTFTKPISDNQGKINKVPFVDGSSGGLPVSIAQTSDKIIQVNKPSKELIPPQENTQLPIKGAIVEPTLAPNEPHNNQNQQKQVTPGFPDGSSGGLPISIAQTSDKIIQVNKPSQDLKPPQENTQLPIKGAIIEPTLAPNEPHNNQNQQKQVTPGFPDGISSSGGLPISIAQTSDKIIQVNKPSQDLKPPQENTQLPIKGAIVEPTLAPNEPHNNQNQQKQVTPGFPNGMHTHNLPGKLIINGKNTTGTFPNTSSQSPIKVNLQLGNKYQPIQESLTSIAENLNIPTVSSSGLGDLVKYGLPRYVSQSSPSKSHAVITPGKIDTLGPNRPNDILNVGYPPVNYDHPIFNDWFNKQMVNIKPKTPYMGNPLNFHSLKFFLIRTLFENGIRLSEDGNLYDANGNILKLSNLKIRPVFLGDPRDYEKLMATNKCVIPYDIPYLEAILLTLEYPPRILAVIPLSLGHLLSSTNNVQPRLGCVGSCGHCSTCPTKFRSGVSEEDEMNENLQSSEDSQENNETYNYVYTASHNDLPLNVNSEPKKRCSQSECQVPPGFQSDYPENLDLDLTTLRRTLNIGINDEENNESSHTTDETSVGTEEENELINSNDISPESKSAIGDSFLNILTPIGLGVFNNVIPIPKRRKCGQDNCQEHPISESGSSGDDSSSEVNNIKELFDIELLDEEVGGNLHETEERSYDSFKELLMDETSNSKPDQNVLFLQLKQNDQGVLNGDVIFLDQENGIVENKPLDYFEITQDNDKKSEDEDYEMLNIRIVGGNPATSSGTPVISRGRSGLIDH